MKNDFLDDRELAGLGLKRLGRHVRISRHALLFGADRIEVGDYCRIDAFCILSAGADGLRIGRNVHISAYTAILGRMLVDIGDFATISVRCTIFSSSDDYSGAAMTNPTIPLKYRCVQDAPVYVGAHAIVGAGSIVLPGVCIGESVAVGAGSLVKQNVPPFTIVAGVPAKRLGQRKDNHRALAVAMIEEESRRQPGEDKSPSR